MKHFTEEEFNKLPKWAQSKVSSLENDYKGTLSELQTYFGLTPSPVYVERYFRDGAKKNYLPNEPVTFELPQGKVTVMLNADNTALDINGYTSLYICPRASNSVYVKMEDRK